MIPYPDAVGLYPAAGDGVRLLPSASVVTPTFGGVAVPVIISTTNSTAEGLYTLLLQASGGGVSRTLLVQVNVLQPGFDLGLTPTAQTLARGQAVPVTLTTIAQLGDSRPVSLDLEEAPAGLQWPSAVKRSHPAKSATLILTDTDLLAPGVYTLTISGANGVDR